MNDLISRQAAIDAMAEAYEDTDAEWILRRLPSAQPELDEWCTDCKEYDQKRHCCPRYNRVIREARDALSVQPEQRWIPCREKLPKPNENVLVTLIDRRRRKKDANWNGEKRYSIRIDKIVDYEGDMSHPFWAKGNTLSVIAWMPLPEPYKEDEE